LIICNANEPERYRKLADKIAMPKEIKIDVLVIGAQKKYAIERKDIVSDLRHSLHDGRLWRQCEYLEQLREQGYKPMIVLEGEMWKAFKFGKMTYGEWIGCQVGIAGFGIPTVRVNSFVQFKDLLNNLNERAGKVTQYVEPVIKDKDRTIEDERIDMLRMITAIGDVKAKAILSRYGDIPTVIEHLDDAYFDTLIGKGARRFRQVLGRGRWNV
jgi:ERCC4-type nuclease